jgi:hypothetical protein
MQKAAGAEFLGQLGLIIVYRIDKSDSQAPRVGGVHTMKTADLWMLQVEFDRNPFATIIYYTITFSI